MERGYDTTEYPHTPNPSSVRASPPGVRVGEVIAGKYRIERVLGAGGMGVVVAVTHLQLGVPYALKFLLPENASDPEIVARFLREARAAVRIKSEHIARVSDVGQLDDGSPFILMEHLTGQDLGSLLRARGPLPVAEAVDYVLQACAGIAEAHALGFVHRDLKPSNLFLTRRSDGEPLVKVLDFGIAKAVGEAHDPNLTATRAVFGSPAFMSPEQVRSARKVDFRTDVWALGVILYNLLTHKLPFTGETSAGLLAAIAADEPEKLCTRRPDAGAQLEAIVSACLQKDLTKRIQTVAELADALVPYASERVVSIGRIRRLAQSGPTDAIIDVSSPSATKSAPPPPTSNANAEPTQTWGPLGSDDVAVSAIIAAPTVTASPWAKGRDDDRNAKTKRTRGQPIVRALAAVVVIAGLGYVVARWKAPQLLNRGGAPISAITDTPPPAAAPTVSAPVPAPTPTPTIAPQQATPITPEPTTSIARPAAPSRGGTTPARGARAAASIQQSQPITPPAAQPPAPAPAPPHPRDPLGESH